jgi:hypothetical protein
MMCRVGRTLVVFLAVLALAGSAVAAQQPPKRFPALRYGVGAEPNWGGGTFAGVRYKPHQAVVAWAMKARTLTLYLLRQKHVGCSSLDHAITAPGLLVQALITARPLSRVVGHVIPNQTLQFVLHRDGRVAVGAMKQGVRLVLTRIDSHRGGVWHGRLSVPKKIYADGKLYGYRGTFAARWCQVR